jgi:hypothetical protein
MRDSKSLIHHFFPAVERRAHRPDRFGTPLRGPFYYRPVPPRRRSLAARNRSSGFPRSRQ